MSLKFTEELSAMKIQSDEKFGEELTYRCKIEMKNLANCNLSMRKS